MVSASGLRLPVLVEILAALDDLGGIFYHREAARDDCSRTPVNDSYVLNRTGVEYECKVKRELMKQTNLRPVSYSLQRADSMRHRLQILYE